MLERLPHCRTKSRARSAHLGKLPQRNPPTGYYGFIGTETVISNIFACRYGTQFLWRLFKEGKSVGEAFDELLSDDTLFPYNTLYTCFADRKFQFVSAPTVVPAVVSAPVSAVISAVMPIQ